MRFEPPEDCTCEWHIYNRGRDVKVIPNLGCPVHGKGQRQIRCPSCGALLKPVKGNLLQECKECDWPENG